MFSDPILGCYGIKGFADWMGQQFATKKELEDAISGGGGGGGGEQFEQVYTTTLAEAAQYITITTEDMGGVYVDIIAYIETPVLAADKLCMLGAFADAEMSQGIGNEYIRAEANRSIEGSFCFVSSGGMLYGGSVSNAGSTVGFLPRAEGGGPYPTDQKPGIAIIMAGFDDGSSIPAETTITIYARRKVTANAQA